MYQRATLFIWGDLQLDLALVGTIILFALLLHSVSAQALHKPGRESACETSNFETFLPVL